MHSPARSDVLEHVSCALCGADDTDIIYEAQYERVPDLIEKFRASGDELLIDRLVRCRRCGLKYISPRLRSDHILFGYTEGEDPAYVSQLEARERTFERSLGVIEQTLGRKGTLLDIGTAAGAFVATAKRAGWDASGCEPNKWLAEWGSRHYGITIRQGHVFEQDFEPGTFDVVTLWDVIEHTPDPAAVIERCRTLLKPGGLLVVNYPDIGSWIARLLKRKWLFLISVHLFYFDRRTMRQLLEQRGFDVVLTRPHWQWLQLDYILHRGASIAPRLSAAARKAASWLKLGDAHVPYWLGQTFVIGRQIKMLVLLLLSHLPSVLQEVPCFPIVA
jgi:2-polyprenyl-3-methyl-5-hydroxy-6-metoxy-1,4-benzoquinol methylase